MRIRVARKILKGYCDSGFKKYSRAQVLKAHCCVLKRKSYLHIQQNWMLPLVRMGRKFRERLAKDWMVRHSLYGLPVLGPNKVYVLSTPHGGYDEYILNANRDLVDSMAMRTEIAIQKQEAVK